MRQYFVSAIAVLGSILVMAATSNLPDSRARAAEECLAAPKGSAPQGSHWHYRTDRATQRKCWFLAEPGAKASPSATARATPPMRLPPERPKRPSDATAGVEQGTKPHELDAKAYAITPLRTETSGDATSGQAASREATSREDRSAADPLVASALLERGQASPIRLASLLVFLAGVLASAIFAVRAILKRSTRVRVDRAVYASRLAPLAPQNDASRLGADGADARSLPAVRRAPQDDGREAMPFQRKVAA